MNHWVYGIALKAIFLSMTTLLIACGSDSGGGEPTDNKATETPQEQQSSIPDNNEEVPPLTSTKLIKAYLALEQPIAFETVLKDQENLINAYLTSGSGGHLKSYAPITIQAHKTYINDLEDYIRDLASVHPTDSEQISETLLADQSLWLAKIKSNLEQQPEISSISQVVSDSIYDDISYAINTHYEQLNLSFIASAILDSNLSPTALIELYVEIERPIAFEVLNKAQQSVLNLYFTSGLGPHLRGYAPASIQTHKDYISDLEDFIKNLARAHAVDLEKISNILLADKSLWLSRIKSNLENPAEIRAFGQQLSSSIYDDISYAINTHYEELNI